jgi:hypothetical protein
MGLITALVTLPLAPVRGTVWIADKIREQAESEYYDERTIQTRLMEIDAARAAGEVDADAAEREENELLDRLMEGRARR